MCCISRLFGRRVLVRLSVLASALWQSSIVGSFPLPPADEIKPRPKCRRRIDLTAPQQQSSFRRLGVPCRDPVVCFRQHTMRGTTPSFDMPVNGLRRVPNLHGLHFSAITTRRRLSRPDSVTATRMTPTEWATVAPQGFQTLHPVPGAMRTPVGDFVLERRARLRRQDTRPARRKAARGRGATRH
jgi:hypothetical protein